MKSTTTIAIADPSLRDSRGHHFELSKHLTPAHTPDNIRLVWFTNREFTDTYNKIHIHPVFTYTMYDRYANINSNAGLFSLSKNILRSLIYKCRLNGLANRIRGHSAKKRAFSLTSPETLAAELKHGIECAGLRASDHVLFHTTDAPMYWAILILFTHTNADALPFIHLVTPYIPDFMPNKDSTFPIIFSIALLQSAGILNKKVFLYAETEFLANHLSFLWGTAVKPLCLPPPEIELDDKTDTGEPITITMLGAAREEKGFLLLPDIARSFWDEYGKNKKIRFIIQCNPQIVGYTRNIRESIDLLKEYDNSYVQLIEQQQNSDAYYQCLKTSDIILLIYDREKYGIRGSGIATESISLGKPILATRETFPESLLKYGAGEAASELQGYIDALKLIIDKYPEYHKKAMIGASLYRKTYSLNNYFDTIVSSTNTQHISDPCPRALVSNTESTSLSSCCRLLELIYCLLGLGYEIDLLADSALIKSLTQPDINVQLRCLEFFGKPSLPGEHIRLIHGFQGDQLEVFLATLSRIKALNHDNKNYINIEDIYSIFVTDNKKSTKAIISTIPTAKICQTTLRHYAQFNDSIWIYRGKSLKNRPLIAPGIQISTFSDPNRSQNRTSGNNSFTNPVLAPPVSTGKTSVLDPKGILARFGIDLPNTDHKPVDITVLVSDLMLRHPEINRLLDKLVRLLDNPRKIRISIINSDYTKHTAFSSDILSGDLRTLLLSDAVLTIENNLTENSIYKLLSIYHFVPVVCALQLDKRNITNKCDLPVPVFNDLNDAASYLNNSTASDTQLASASWSTYLRVTNSYNSDNYRQIWIDAIRSFHGPIKPD